MSTWHVINIALSSVSVIIWIVWALHNRSIWRYAVAPLSYLAHVILFYAGTSLHIFSPLALNAWSNAVRLHGLILIGTIGIALLCAERCNLWKRLK